MPFAATTRRLVSTGRRPLTAWPLVACLAAGCGDTRSSAPRSIAPTPTAARPAAIVPASADLVPVVLTPPRPLPASRLPVPTTRPESTAGWRPLAQRHSGLVQPVAATEEVAGEPGHLPSVDAAGPTDRGIPHGLDGIQRLFEGYASAFNRHDAPAAAAHWSVDGENVDLETGAVTRGRRAVQEVFADLFAVDDAAAITIQVSGVKPLHDDIAVVDGTSRIAYADGSVAGSRFSAVVAREAGASWRLRSVRETAATVDAAPPRPLEALAWLAGSWEDLGEGQTASTQAAWSADRGFLVRTHVVTPTRSPDSRPRSGDAAIPGLLPPGSGRPRTVTEVIGWDPDRQEIRSWHFAADGRFAEAAWARDGSGWLMRLEGRGADAGHEATCRLETASPGRLTVTCDGEPLAGLLPPAGEFERTTR